MHFMYTARMKILRMRQKLLSFPVRQSLLTRKQKCTLLCRVDAISFLSSSISMLTGGILLNQHIFRFPTLA